MPAKLATLNAIINGWWIQLDDLLAGLTPSPEGKNRAQIWASTFGHAKSHGTQLMWSNLSCLRIRKLYQTSLQVPLPAPCIPVSLFLLPSGAKASRQISGPRPRSLGICDRMGKHGDGPMADKHRQASKTSMDLDPYPLISPRNPTAHLLHPPGLQLSGYYEALQHFTLTDSKYQLAIKVHGTRWNSIKA